MRISLLVRFGLIFFLSLGVSACNLNDIFAKLKGDETEASNKEEITQIEEPSSQATGDTLTENNNSDQSNTSPDVNLPIPIAPDDITANINGDQVIVRWSEVEYANAYIIQWSTNEEFQKVESLKALDATPIEVAFPYKLPLLLNPLFIRVYAENTSGISEYSSTIILKATISEVYANADIARGGRLYDTWWDELKTENTIAEAPTIANPLWEFRNTQVSDLIPEKKIKDSWRCTTCHGWSYNGIGFISGTRSIHNSDNLIYKISLLKESGLAFEEQLQYIFSTIKTGFYTDKFHDFSSSQTGLPTTMTDSNLWDLVKFLYEGIINTDIYITSTFGTFITPYVKGPYRNFENGQGLYKGEIEPTINCTSCHGDDGKGIAEKGTKALDIFELAYINPYQFLHKIRFGQPNTPMPGLSNTTVNFENPNALHILDFARQKFDSRTVSP